MFRTLTQCAATGLKFLPLGGGALPRYGFFGFNSVLPGTNIDWRRQAGDLWDNSVVRSALKWQEDACAEPLLVVRRPDPADGGKLKPVLNHRLVRLLENPNPF